MTKPFLKKNDPVLLVEQIQQALNHQKKGEMDEAEKIYRCCLKMYPDNTDVLQIAAIFFDQIGHRDFFNYETLLSLAFIPGLETVKSMNYLIRAIQLDPGRDEAKSLFAVMLSQGQQPKNINRDLQDIILSCLASRNVDYNNLGNMWYRQFFEDADNKSAAELLNTGSYEDFKSLFEISGYKESLLTPFFIEGVKKIIVFNVPLENLLMHLRQYYLERISEKKSLDESEYAFLAALSIQMFLNEYIFSETLNETQKIEALILDKSNNIAIYSCYRPLINLLSHGALFQENCESPLFLQNILETHIAQILEERSLRKGITTLGEVTDETSRVVQDQYEENPYPRWQGYNFIDRLSGARNFHEQHPEILVAGCGTGRNIFNARTRYPLGKITAVDLSRSSIAYAMMKVRDYNLRNVKFFQADILMLEQLKKKFDVVECMGVLHHMKDPGEGLKVLTDLLKEDGRLDLGLYSEYGRREVVHARELIAEQEFKPNPEGIRACRSYIKQNPDFQYLKISPDFFSVSACRDLLFHVQEIRYTIPTIKKLLEDNSLKFLNFKLHADKLALYRQAFPDDETTDNLDNWDRFEQDNPQFFSRMYQFSCRKI